MYENDEPLIQNLAFPLQGVYQQKNILGVIQGVNLLKSQAWKISEQHVRSGPGKSNFSNWIKRKVAGFK